MKLLIGVDDSPFSEAAVEFVRTMRWPEGTHAIVASSLATPLLAYTEVTSAIPIEDMLGEARKQGQALVSRCARKLQNESLRVETQVLEGDPRESLIDLAKSERVDLIIVGSHGRTGLDKLLMGSVASHIVAHAPCSTLVVKRREK